MFLHTSEVSFGQYLALLTAADAFLVTSLREGMALRTHEYVICQEGKARPLILSEVGMCCYLTHTRLIYFSSLVPTATADSVLVCLSTHGTLVAPLRLFSRPSR